MAFVKKQKPYTLYSTKCPIVNESGFQMGLLIKEKKLTYPPPFTIHCQCSGKQNSKEWILMHINEMANVSANQK